MLKCTNAPPRKVSNFVAASQLQPRPRGRRRSGNLLHRAQINSPAPAPQTWPGLLEWPAPWGRPRVCLNTRAQVSASWARWPTDLLIYRFTARPRAALRPALLPVGPGNWSPFAARLVFQGAATRPSANLWILIIISLSRSDPTN